MLYSLLLLLFYFQGKKFNLKDLFEIKQGATVPSKNSGTGEYCYKVIYPSNLNSCFKQLDLHELAEYRTDKEIKTDKTLSKYDYLIACKGAIKGFSLYYSGDVFTQMEKTEAEGIIASNHMIMLRPRKTIPDLFLDSYYLHNLLDLTVARFLENLNNQADNEDSKKTKFITINDLESIELHFNFIEGMNTSNLSSGSGTDQTEIFNEIYMKKVTDFNRLQEDWQTKLAELKKIEEELYLYNEKLKEEVTITIPVKP